jgi:NADH dehydrogenase FAD-containing subunit
MSLLRYQLSRKRRFADRVHTGRGGRIDVDADLTLPSVTGVYALGDFANITGKAAYRCLSSPPSQNSRASGVRNTLLEISGEPGTPFHYLDKGIMAIIGRSSGVAEVGEHRYQMQGAILRSVAWSAYTPFNLHARKDRSCYGMGLELFWRCTRR